MPSNFPGAIDNIANNKTDNTSAANDHAPHHNDLADAIRNIQTSLGVNLANVANATNLTSGTVNPARLASGTANSTTFLAGNSVWATISASVGGANTQIQFNDSTSANGSVAFTFDKSTNVVSIGNSTVNVSINSTAFSGTANNATNLGGSSLATIQGQITGNAATAYSNAVANAAALYQTTAGLAANVATLTSNNSNNLNGQPASFYTNATNITTGTLPVAQLPANVVFWSNTNSFSAVQTFNQDVVVNVATLSVGNTTSNITANTTVLKVGNTTVNVTINSTAFTGTANNSTNLGGSSLATIQSEITGNAATAYSNAVANAAALYQTTAGLAANVATLTANNSNNLGGQNSTFYTNATNLTTGTLPFARLPANAVFWSNTNTFTAVQTFNQNVVVNAATVSVGNTTANITANTTELRVGNSTVNVSINSTAFSGIANNSNNLGGVAASGYQTTAGLSANVATLTSNNSLNLGGAAAASYINTSGAYTITGVHTRNANLIVNSAILSVGNTIANVTTNTTHIVVGNSTVNVSVNSTAFSGTANNSNNLNGQPASFYTNATNLATGTVPTARLASGTANSTTFLAGNSVWTTISASVGGSNQQIQFNDSGAANGSAALSFDKSTNRLTVGNSTVNVAISSGTVVAGQPIVVVTSNSYTFTANDIGKIIEFSNTSVIAATVPNNASVSIATGSQIIIVQLEANTIQVTNGSGVSIFSRGNLANTAGQYAVAFLYKRDTDLWILSGDVN